MQQNIVNEIVRFLFLKQPPNNRGIDLTKQLLPVQHCIQCFVCLTAPTKIHQQGKMNRARRKIKLFPSSGRHPSSWNEARFYRVSAKLSRRSRFSSPSREFEFSRLSRDTADKNRGRRATVPRRVSFSHPRARRCDLSKDREFPSTVDRPQPNFNAKRLHSPSQYLFKFCKMYRRFLFRQC